MYSTVLHGGMLCFHFTISQGLELSEYHARLTVYTVVVIRLLCGCFTLSLHCILHFAFAQSVTTNMKSSVLHVQLKIEQQSVTTNIISSTIGTSPYKITRVTTQTSVSESIFFSF